jgi:hypothetical protein
MEALDVRSATAADREAIAGIVGSSWGVTTVVVHAAVYDPLDLGSRHRERENPR